MPIDLVVNNNHFAYPSPGDEPGWGPPATNWATEVTDVLANIQNPDDITQTSFSLANNTSTPTNIFGLAFNPGTVRSAVVDYSIYIHTTSAEFAEKGTLDLVYKNGGTIGSKWSIARVIIGDDAGINFNILDSGQVQYTSTNVAGTGYTAVIKFEARTTAQ